MSKTSGSEGYAHFIKHFLDYSRMANGLQGIVESLPGQGVICSAAIINPSLQHICAACVKIHHWFGKVAIQVFSLAQLNSEFTPVILDICYDSMMAKNFQSGFTYVEQWYDSLILVK